MRDNIKKEDRFGSFKILLAIFIVAIVLRIALNIARQELFFHIPFLLSGEQLYAQTDDRVSHDALCYLCSGEGFLKGRGVVSMKKIFIPETLVNFKNTYAEFMDVREIDQDHYIHKGIPPLYPLFLSLCFFIGGFNLLAFFIPQIIISSLTCLLIYSLAEEVFNKGVALIAGFVTACYPDLIFWSGFARTETLFIFLICLGFLLLIKGNSHNNLVLIYLSAVVFGLVCLTRITFTPFVIILLVWQFYSFSKKKRESFRMVLLMAVIIFLVLLPWGIRNYVVFGEFNILSEEAGILVGSVKNKEQYTDVKINNGYEAYKTLLLRVPVFIKDNFKVYSVSCLRRFWTFWMPYTYIMRPWAKLYKGLTWSIIFPAAFWGMFISRKKMNSNAWLIIIFIFYYSLLHACCFVDLGLVYRYPIQPFLCIFAAYTFYDFYIKRENNLSIIGSV